MHVCTYLCIDLTHAHMYVLMYVRSYINAHVHMYHVFVYVQTNMHAHRFTLVIICRTMAFYIQVPLYDCERATVVDMIMGMP